MGSKKQKAFGIPKPLTPFPSREMIVERLPPPSRSSEKIKSPQQKPSVHGDKKREPKFVPYEPYKAAVKPLSETEEAAEETKVAATMTKPKVTTTVTNTKTAKPKAPVAKPIAAATSLTKKSADTKLLSTDTPKASAEKKTKVMPVAPMILSKLTLLTEPGPKLDSPSERDCLVDTVNCAQEISKLKEENQCLKEQLQVQTKVNADLKKLLVASVGEDFEAKVQFLTEDKVKLAHDVQHYVQRLLADNEELEKLSIQCDVWRSKFLASSLIVDELAKWKAVLYRRFDESLEAVRQLLDEQTKIKDNLKVSYRNLVSVRDAVDPKSSSFPLSSMPSTTTTSLAESVNKLSIDVRRAILTGNQKIFSSSPTEGNLDEPSPGEQLALQVLANPSLCHPPLENLTVIGMNSKLTKAAGIAYRFHPDVRYELLTMNCCGHCQGEIKLL